ncbi:Protein of unknown function [Gryllus bimaculatus]|nr:Protein of unknown function [Gryllus bimaculatus]
MVLTIQTAEMSAIQSCYFLTRKIISSNVIERKKICSFCFLYYVFIPAYYYAKQLVAFFKIFVPLLISRNNAEASSVYSSEIIEDSSKDLKNSYNKILLCWTSIIDWKYFKDCLKCVSFLGRERVCKSGSTPSKKHLSESPSILSLSDHRHSQPQTHLVLVWVPVSSKPLDWNSPTGKHSLLSSSFTGRFWYPTGSASEGYQWNLACRRSFRFSNSPPGTKNKCK